MRTRDITFESNLFEGAATGNIMIFDPSRAKGFDIPFVIVTPEEIDDDKSVIMLKDETASFDASLIKEENIAFNTRRPVIVPISSEEIPASTLEAIFEEARNQLYELGYEIGEKVILVGWNYELSPDIFDCSLEDEGLEVLINNIFNVDNDLKR